MLAPLYDQRGALRNPTGQSNGAIDIGAYELSSTYLVTSTADSLASGTLRAAIAWVNTASAQLGTERHRVRLHRCSTRPHPRRSRSRRPWERSP